MSGSKGLATDENCCCIITDVRHARERRSRNTQKIKLNSDGGDSGKK
jgi:hypothetical protein